MANAPLTAAFAGAIVNSDPTTDAATIDAARTAIIDFLACMIAGGSDRTTSVLAKAVGADLPGGAILNATRKGLLLLPLK